MFALNAEWKLSVWTQMKFASLVAHLCHFNRNCLLCSQVSSELICPICAADIPSFDLSSVNNNLLNNPRIAMDLKQCAFDELVAISEYTWPLSNLIAELKFSNKQTNAKALAKLFCRKALPSMGNSPELLIPVPLHSARLASRKYNQAALLSKEISLITQIPVQYNAVRRVKNTQPQSRLNEAKRAKNIYNAFALQQTINAKHIAIVDDVVTTGATVSAVSKAISATYCRMQIDVWAICVTPEHR